MESPKRLILRFFRWGGGNPKGWVNALNVVEEQGDGKEHSRG